MDRGRERERERDERERERDRDRDRERERDRRGDGEVTKMGAGESYRPRGGAGERGGGFRLDRERTPPRRSPMRDNWRARPRTPPRPRSPPRRYSPRRDDDRRARSPPRRDERRRSRSPFDRERDRAPPRARSPLGRRSPPPAVRNFRERSRSPLRRDSRPPPGANSSSWRRRSPSPPLPRSGRSTPRTSTNTSRRSSPHIHAERVHLTHQTGRDSRPRSPPRERERSPPLSLVHRERDRASARSTPRERSPVRPVIAKSPPRGPAAAFRAPTGPSRNFTAPAPSPSMSAHNRPENKPVVPPAGPRGYQPAPRGAPYGIRGGRSSFGNDRHVRPDAGSWNAPTPTTAQTPTRPSVPEISTRTPSIPNIRATTIPIPSPSIPSGPSSATTPSAITPSAPSVIPTGPRAGVPPPRPTLHPASSIYTSSTRQPSSPSSRPHPAMANLPSIIPLGRIDPSHLGMTIEAATRLKRREEEAEALREELNAKQEKLRQSLKTWNRYMIASREGGLRSELSERHVRLLAGEGSGGAAF